MHRDGSAPAKDDDGDKERLTLDSEVWRLTAFDDSAGARYRHPTNVRSQHIIEDKPSQALQRMFRG